MNITDLTPAEAAAELESSQESCRRLIQAHPRAERVAEMAKGITPLELNSDCRRAVATIRYHMARIEQLEARISQTQQTGETA